MAKDIGVPGNSMEEARQFGQMLLKYGEGLTLWDHICSHNFRGQIEVTGFSVRPPQMISGEWLVVVRGLDAEGGPVVAFHSGMSVGEAVAGASGRVQNGTIKWRPDEYRR